MPEAYILITTEVGAEEEVLEILRKIPNVVEADIVFGIYDIVAKVRGETIENIRRLVVQTIRGNIKKITSTQTLVVVEE